MTDYRGDFQNGEFKGSVKTELHTINNKLDDLASDVSGLYKKINGLELNLAQVVKAKDCERFRKEDRDETRRLELQRKGFFPTNLVQWLALLLGIATFVGIVYSGFTYVYEMRKIVDAFEKGALYEQQKFKKDTESYTRGGVNYGN